MQLYTREFGPNNAPTILFLHGGGLSGRQWQPQIERLGDYHCLAPDLPEQGESYAVGPLTLAGATEQVHDLISTHSHGGRVHLVASSFGCAIALNLLDVASDLVETAIVSGGTAGLGRILGAISLAGTGIYRIIPMETLIKLSYQQFSIPAQYQPMFHDDIARVLNADFTRKITTAMMHVQLPAHTRVPVLAAVGQRETWPAKQAARKIARLLPHGQGVLVPRVGHIWNLQAPDLFTAMIRAWVTHAPLPAELRPL